MAGRILNKEKTKRCRADFRKLLDFIDYFISYFDNRFPGCRNTDAFVGGSR